MSADWQNCTLGDFVRLQRGHDLTAAEQQPGDVPIMGSAGPNGSHCEALAKGPGVVIGRSGASAGRVHFSEVDYWPHNTCLYVTDFLGNNPRFAYYLLQTIDLATFNSGSAQPSLNRNFLYSIPLKIPTRNIQDQIVETLQALDDRITLLRETNTTLEAIAQALFKSWFVDFDPVHAKMQGHAPEGMDETTAALFPDSFEDSELGAVPKGWIHCSLKEVCAIFDSKRAPLSGAERAKRQGPYPYYGAASLMDHVDDYLFDGIYLLTGEDGSVADEHGFPITQYVWGKFWVNNHAHILQGKAGFSTEHLALALRRVNIEPFITGAVQAKLSQSNMWRINVLNPGHDISAAFGLQILPLYEAIRANEERAKTLASVRDTLLPRLISGQLSISDALTEMDGV